MQKKKEVIEGKYVSINVTHETKKRFLKFKQYQESEDQAINRLLNYALVEQIANQ